MNTNKKILIVDDDAFQRKSLHDILKAKGYKPIAIARGKTALEKAKKEKPAVALVDLKLPDMRGLKVMKGIKKCSPATECIVLTGHATKESAIEAVNLGAFNYFLKPYDMEQLLLSIHRAVEKQEAEGKYRTLIENANDAILITDVETGKIIDANKKAETLLGLPVKDIIGMHQSKLHPPESSKQYREIFKKYLHKGGIASDVFVTHKDGHKIPVEISGSVTTIGGRRVVQGIFRDITERKQVEDALRDSSKELLIRNRIADVFLTVTGDEMYAEVLQVVLDAMDSKYGIFAYIDENGNVVCPSMTRDVWDKCQMDEKTIVFPPGNWPCTWGRVLKEKKTIYSNKPFKVPKGHIRISRVLCVPILHQEKLLGHLQVANKETDYTEKDRILLEAIAGHIAPVLHEILEKDRYEKERRQIEQALRFIVEGTADVTGIDFLRCLVKQLGSVLGFRYVLVGEMIPAGEDRIKTLAVWADGKYADNLEYDLAGTPCENVIAKKYCIYQKSIQQLFPEDRMLTEMGVESYVGVPLIDSSGKVKGILAALHDKPMENMPFIESIMTIFSVRTTAEIERQQAEEKLKKINESYDRLTDNANEAIFRVKKKGGEVVYANSAAERIFGYSLKEWQSDPTLGLRIIHPDYREKQKKVIEKINATKKTIKDTVLCWIAKDNRDVFMEYTIIPIMNKKNEIIYFESIGRDITERQRAEDNLRKSEERYRSIFETASNLIISVNNEGIIVDCNNRIKEVLGYTKDEIIGQSMAKIIHPDYINKAQKSLEEILTSGYSFDNEYKMVKKDKKVIDIKINSSGLKDKNGQYIKTVCIIEDVTEQKQAVEALRESEKWFRALFEQAGDAAFLVGPNGKFEDVNQRACNALGYSKEELLEMAVSDIDPVYHKKRFKQFFQNLDMDVPVTIEAVHRRQDGVVFPVEIRTALINVRGKPHLLSLARDITMRKKVEEALIISEERFRLIFQNSPIGIATSDTSLRFNKVNKAFCDMLGYTEQELTRLTINDITFPEDKKESISLAKSLLKGKTSGYSMEKRYLKKDGQFFWGSLTTSIARDAKGKPLYAIGMVEDITERKEAEENVKVLAKFPSESPNPVLRIKNDGIIQFANKASQPVLDELIKKTEHFSSYEWKLMIWDIHISQETRDLNLTINKRIYSLTFTPIAGTDYLYVYGLDITKRKQAEGKLTISYKKVRNLSAHLQKVREEERTSIAREIHDELGQLLTALQMDLSNLADELPQDDKSLLKKTKSLFKLIDLSIQTTQKISSDLRPSILDNLGVIPAIKRHAKEFQSYSKIKCVLNFENDDIVMDKDLSTVIFRIFQETITNVSRHAKATRIRTSMKKENGSLILRIHDNGRGITEEEIADPKSLGIIGIRERAHAVGGHVKIDGVKDKGTTVTVTIPISNQEKLQ